MGISPKVNAAALGGAGATVIWIVVAAVSPGTFTDAAITSLTGATATIFAFLFGYVIRDPDRPSPPAKTQDGSAHPPAA